MKLLVPIILSFLLSIRTVQSFVAPVVVVAHPKTKATTTTTTTTTTTQIQYKDRDEIAHELMELIPGEHRAKVSKYYYNPWKRIMELENAEDQARELRTKLETMKSEKHTIERLEQLVYSLFLITRELNMEEVKLLVQLSLMEEERNSARKLLKQTFSVVNKRIKNTVGKNVDRFLRLVHLYHEKSNE
jgi:hypothetical protein